MNIAIGKLTSPNIGIQDSLSRRKFFEDSGLPSLERPSVGAPALVHRMLSLASQIDENKAHSIQTAVQICELFLGRLKTLSADRLKQLNDRATYLRSTEIWSAVTSICSVIGSAFAFVTGICSANPTTAVVGLAFALLPSIYNAFSTGIDPQGSKKFEQTGVQFACLLATALFFYYFQIQLPITNLQVIFSSTLPLVTALSNFAQNVYRTRLKFTDAQLEALDFLLNTLQKKLQKMTGSIQSIPEIVENIFSSLKNAMSSHTDTIKNVTKG